MYYLCVVSMIVWAISAISWLISAVIHLNLIHFFLFVGSDIIFSIFFFLTIVYAKQQSVMAAKAPIGAFANEWPQTSLEYYMCDNFVITFILNIVFLLLLAWD